MCEHEGNFRERLRMMKRLIDLACVDIHLARIVFSYSERRISVLEIEFLDFSATLFEVGCYYNRFVFSVLFSDAVVYLVELWRDMK